MKNKAHYLIPVAALFCLVPVVPSALALLLGATIALMFGNPYIDKTRNLTHKFLTYSVSGLGAGMNLNVVAKVGLQGFAYTITWITMTMGVGLLLGRLFKTERDPSLLITAGTAICGGSAIAAVAPTIRAKNHDVSVSLGTVFLLNATALFIFPIIGHFLNLTQTQFGLWSALAIHDTSSVVGATLQYGPKALEIGTTVKLARALWIVPLTLIIGFFTDKKSNEPQTNAKRPWFILGFIVLAALVTWIPALHTPGHYIEIVSKRGLVLTLFLIGSNISWATLKAIGWRPFLQGFSLWLIVASTTLGAIFSGWIV